jgi:type IV pilus assembly protein PilB
MRGRTVGEILVEWGLITQQQLDEALDKQRQLKSGKRLGDLLVSMGYITDRDRVRSLGEQWGVSFVDLSDIDIPQGIEQCIPRAVARRFKVFPTSWSDGRITLAMKNPLDIFAIDEIRLITGADVEPVIATEDDILAAINSRYGGGEAMADAVSDLVKGMDTGVSFQETKSEEDVSIDQILEQSAEAPVIRMANMIITRAVQEKCSDIHLEPAKDRLRVRYRIDGILQDAMDVPRQVQFAMISRFKIMSDMDIAEKRAPQDGRFGASIEGKPYDFRVSSLPGINGEKIVLRILDKSSINMGMESLGIPRVTLEQFEKVFSRTYGIVLVTGPTGSGKSTTLYSVLTKLNSGEKNILTLENPVEYELAGITQVDINEKAGLTFSSGLRSMLRQDPDIMMVGEIRDAETGTIAIEAALTGHLVLSTLHTNDAPTAVSRLIEMGIEPFLVSSSVIGVLAQRLVRTICPKCKDPYEPPAEAVKRLGLRQEANQQVTFYRGKGCDVCRRTGYKGRCGVYELMVMNDEIRDLTLRKAGAHEIKDASIRAGMRTLRDDAMEKVLLGITTPEEALRVIYAG